MRCHSVSCDVTGETDRFLVRFTTNYLFRISRRTPALRAFCVDGRDILLGGNVGWEEQVNEYCGEVDLDDPPEGWLEPPPGWDEGDWSDYLLDCGYAAMREAELSYLRHRPACDATAPPCGRVRSAVRSRGTTRQRRSRRTARNTGPPGSDDGPEPRRAAAPWGVAA